MSLTHKNCKYCMQSLPVTEFSKRTASPDGLGYKCKACAAKYGKARYHESEDVRRAAKQRALSWKNSNEKRSQEIKALSKAKKLAADPDYDNRRARELRLKSPEKVRTYGLLAAHRRRAREASAGVTHPGVYQRLMARAEGVCTYCGGVFEVLTLDHFEPLAKGGNGAAENLFPCCKGCNSSKRDKNPADWIVEKFGVDGLLRALAANTKLYAARLP